MRLPQNNDSRRPRLATIVVKGCHAITRSLGNAHPSLDVRSIVLRCTTACGIVTAQQLFVLPNYRRSYRTDSNRLRTQYRDIGPCTCWSFCTQFSFVLPFSMRNYTGSFRRTPVDFTVKRNYSEITSLSPMKLEWFNSEKPKVYIDCVIKIPL